MARADGVAERALGRRVGGSTGAIFCAALTLAEAMRVAGAAGSIVGILCDGGERYADTLYSPAWRAEHGLGDACAAAERAVAALADPAAAARGDGGSLWTAAAAVPPQTAAAAAAAAAALPSRIGTDAWPMTVLRKQGEADRA